MKIVGWFQGRMEFGSRALGNCSLADPRRKDMNDILNARIKFREHFRPFCPSVLAEAAGLFRNRLPLALYGAGIQN
jgi:carbamoyltransferase